LLGLDTLAGNRRHFFRKSISESIAAYIKKAQATFQAIFKPKQAGLSSQVWFLFWDSARSPHRHLCLKVPGGKRLLDDPLPPYALVMPPADFFSPPEGKAEAF
jgi:hypothetical protein